LFATVYILVAGTILLNNMSTISMIPLNLRKSRLERAVLTQFGDSLDEAALRELATGPVIKRLQLSANRPDGLEECTREMFSLAMLVRMGKVTEQDIRETFAAFRKLDVNDEGVLNSKSIIAGMIQKRLTDLSGRARRRKQRTQLSPVPSLQHQDSARLLQPNHPLRAPPAMPSPPAPSDLPPPPPPLPPFMPGQQQQPHQQPHQQQPQPSYWGHCASPFGDWGAVGYQTGSPMPTPAELYALNQCRPRSKSTSQSNSGDESYYSTGSSHFSGP